MIFSHKIRFYPNKNQIDLLYKSCGVARFTYNWGLSKWEELYKNGEKPNIYEIKKLFNKIKRDEFPFVTEVTKCASESALFNLYDAYKRFFKKQSKYPTFKKKGKHNSFTISNDQFTIKDKICRLPKIGKVKLSEKLRFNGKIMSATISENSSKWFISILVDDKKDYKLEKTNNIVGIDLGVKDLIITSNGLKFDNPKWIIKSEKKMKKKQKELSRRKISSKRREKTRLRLSKLHQRIVNQRNDYLHKITTYICKTNDIIAMEDLNIAGMIKNHNLAKAISNCSLYEIRRQLEYKCNKFRRILLFVNRFFPSSKICSNCGCIQEKMPLNIREWTCTDCNTHHDRDLNASVNIIRQAVSEYTHKDNQALTIKEMELKDEISDIVKLDWMNCEIKY